MNKRVFTLILIASLIPLLLLPIVQAQSGEDEYDLDLPCYKPTKVTFNYEITTQAGVSEISTVGNSLYKYSGGPSYFEFLAQEVDDYYFVMTIAYTVAKNQTVLVGIWSGSNAMQGLSYKGEHDQIVFRIHLRVQAEPVYPTADEIANLSLAGIRKSLDEQTIQFETTISSLLAQANTNTYMILVTLSTSVIMSVLFVVETRRTRRHSGA